MSEGQPVRGELQQEIMRVLWHTPSASVEAVRAAIPESRRSGYNTVQTVLNRLADRGLVNRIRNGRAFSYSAAVSEADYLSKSMDNLLSGASTEARQAALANLAELLPDAEFDALRRRLGRKRG
jgi:predicted transcriptional regulator